MKFGKHIQSHQVPGWSAYYLDYKFLKKIISSLEANRPASESAALALGLRPGDILHETPSPSALGASMLTDTDPGIPPIFSATEQDEDRGPEFQQHKAAFFFKLERELEKINAFYLQKEAELKLRLETLLSKRRAAAMRGLPDTVDGTTQNHAEWNAVEEGFRLLERDLGKLQQFIEINATGFRKILKKFDKRSKSTTKELYLARQVDVQPVFNRQLISELSDTVASCLLNLADLTSGLKFEGPGASDIFTQQLLTERASYVGPFHDLEKSLRRAVASSDQDAIIECVRFSEAVADDEGQSNATRILWRVIVDAPPDLADLILSSLSKPFNFHFVDDINGRTCLHEAAIAGALRLTRLCVEKGIPADNTDAYGRTALHYAAMNGHPEVCQFLLETSTNLNTLDIDNYSPLVYATLRGCRDCVMAILGHGEVLQPTTPGGDLIPLSLASQSGHVDVVLLLLERGAQCSANSNGEYPMHLAAREGHVEVCKLLLGQTGWDIPDKYHEWTPLFHASRYGHEECVRVLLEAGARANITDELGHLAMHYAAWYGHHGCLVHLLKAVEGSPPVNKVSSILDSSPASDHPDALDSEIDMIPSLSLPPPIMPHRVYGHNYLDRNHLVQVRIGGSSRQDKEFSGVRLHHRLISPAFRDEYLLATTPLRLVITTSAEVNAAPYSMSLPPRDEKGVFVFQISSLNSLTLEFSVYPNFGTKCIGCAVALPSMFTNLETNQLFTIPILDHRLHVVGEVSFELNVITSFDGVTLEVGGDVETYWKSTAISAMPSASSSAWPHRSHLISSASTSPLAQSRSSGNGVAATISSLKGNFLPVKIQVTRDLQPAVFSEWLLPETEFELSVCDTTLAQLETLAERTGRSLNEIDPSTVSDWPALMPRLMISLVQLLKTLPANIGICLEILYPSRKTQERLHLSRRLNLNQVVDSVLKTIYHASMFPDTRIARRRIIFTSSSPDVCAALNWKQPNYPVFFASYCGKAVESSSKLITFDDEDSHDRRVLSLGAAVEFAKMNNLLGIFVDAALLSQVPSLIHGIRNAGLLVGVLDAATDQAFPIDAFLNNGNVVFIDPSSLL